MYSPSKLKHSKDIYLVGEERYMYDFRYVFDDLNIKQLLPDVQAAEVLGRNSRTLLILCARQKDKLKARLIASGYTYGDNLLLADDIFDMFLTHKKDVVVWGAGAEGKRFINDNTSEIAFIIDSGTPLSNICGKKILRPNEVDLRNYYIVVATVKYWPEIKRTLQAHDLKEDVDFTHFHGYMSLSKMMRECINSNPTADVSCSYPFEFCQISPGGYINLCCLGMKPIAGGMKHQPFYSAWHSRLAKILRLSIINKTFVFCDEKPCPIIKAKQEFEYNAFFSPDNYERRSLDWPKEVNVSIDHTCNLACKHCREDVFVASGAEKEDIGNIADKLIDEVIPNVETLVLAGNGEVFFSDTYQKMWKGSMAEKRNSISILTNGILFTPDVWVELSKRYEKIGFSVSIDAATEETYKHIRGGDFKALQKNLDYMGTLRRNNDIWYLHMNFVVRQENVHELKDFILWAKELGADRVRVSKVENWVYDHVEFYRHISVFNENNSIKEEYRDAFSDDVFFDPIIEMVNIKV